MKNKKIIIGGAVVAFVFIAGIAFFNGGNDKKDTVENVMFGGLNINKGIKCTQTVNVGEEGNSVTNTLYFYKNKMRYDSIMKNEVQGQKDMHSINNGGEYTYVWGKAVFFKDGAKGFKIKNDEENNEYAPEYTAKDLEENDYKIPGLTCEKWSPDENMFELPNEVEFMTRNEMMGTAVTQPQNLTAPTQTQNMCAMCDMIPDATARADCKESCTSEQNQ